MTNINAKDSLLTHINVFRVAVQHQRHLVDILVHSTEYSVRSIPGFVSASLHQSLDGTSVTLYSKWHKEQLRQTSESDFLACFAAALDIATLETTVSESVKHFEPLWPGLQVLSDPLRQLSGRRLN
ncbi:hypothetical protein GCM10009092_14780 [Bowmanella denitrificans]|uniref:ABM domain-containing protein n=1 Tax=Bowmanella denitrificans TaxID=366582 RepID=A0ABN0WZR5_9ALTE